ncbi:NB-ARC domain-containing disease resistance protein [Quillaja saponaria]|uniref:NB-ARC domain-containing disease resistance protein n=1 Tax=Quillaja saponaria TaxID=32244 RepID=A0AAD7PE22_QUISA|nr:NB-ARC domain-containing disease resistance protein [Quillaja saponaria]
MAEALVSHSLEQLALVCKTQTEEQVQLVVYHVDKDIKKITNNLQTIKPVLHDAEKKQVTNEAIESWLERLKGASYDMEDVLDEWNTALMKLQIEGKVENAPHMVRSFIKFPCSCCYPFNVRWDIVKKLKVLRGILDGIVNERESYNLETIGQVSNSFRDKVVLEGQKSRICLMDDSLVFGREKEMYDLVRILLSKDRRDKAPHVTSLVGVGGIGKTTLAQCAFKDERVKAHFGNNRIWISVSDTFDEVKVAKAIIEGLNEDDVSPKGQDRLKPFMLALKNSVSGSRVLVTTRDKSVADVFGSVPTIHVSPLSEEHCWLMFREIAFAERNEHQRKELLQIGKEIVVRCKGLPLAAKILGGLIRFKTRKEEWQQILDNKIWELADAAGTELFPHLFLSYYNFPSEIRACFAYCSIFPKNYVMEKDTLIKLWMAQGYLGLGPYGEMVSRGEECFLTLAVSSFFQDFEMHHDGSIRSCKMHDEVHDFAQFLTKNECVTMEVIHGSELKTEATLSSSRNMNARHLTITIFSSGDGFLPEADTVFNFKATKSRTLLALLMSEKGRSTIDCGPPKLANLFLKFPCLRTLDLRGVLVLGIPSQVEKLIHLRYLDLSAQGNLTELPEALCSLCNLQTLKLNNCYNLKQLPKAIGKLINLMHLHMGTQHSILMPISIGRLICLRTLDQYTVSSIVLGENEGCSLKELENLNELQGQLTIRRLGDVRDLREAKIVQLKKKRLNGLHLSFDGNGGNEKQMFNDALLLNGLEPHPYIEALTITDYHGTRLAPNWMTPRLVLTKLKKLYLASCKNLESLPTLGTWPSLQELSIYSITKVKKVGVEFLGLNVEGNMRKLESPSLVLFPYLEKLHFQNMDDWEEWDDAGLIRWEDVNVILPRLSELEISNCPKLKGLPWYLWGSPIKQLNIVNCPILKEACQKEGEDWPKICFIPSVKIN